MGQGGGTVALESEYSSAFADQYWNAVSEDNKFECSRM